MEVLDTSYSDYISVDSELEEEKLDISDEKRADVLISHYEQMREEVREFAKESHQRNMRVITVIALVIGSIFVEQAAIGLLSVIPILITYIFIRQTHAAMWIIKINNHIVRIQQELVVDTFDWEQTTGFGSGDSLRSIVGVYNIIFVVIIYIISCWVGVTAIGETQLDSVIAFSISKNFVITLSQNLIIIFYLALAGIWIGAANSVVETWKDSDLSG